MDTVRQAWGRLEYAEEKGWDDDLTDAAAWFLHRYFILLPKRRSKDDWLPFPFQEFVGMYGMEKYKDYRDRLIREGFLEYNQSVGYYRGHHCSQFRPCFKLRYNRADATYRMRSAKFQERYIESQRQKRITESQYKQDARRTIHAAFSDVTTLSDYDRRWGGRKRIESSCHLIRDGILTEEQFNTIEKLVAHTLQLRVKMNEAELTAMTKQRFDSQKHNCSIEALEQSYKETIEQTFKPRVYKIDDYGRFYTPFTSLPRETWEYVTYENQYLVSIDVRSSHVNCILALVKDIGAHYYGSEGTHAERLANCRFGRQISSVPGLDDHLHRSIALYWGRSLFDECKSTLTSDENESRQATFRLFDRFTQRTMRTLRSQKKRHRFDDDPTTPENCLGFVATLCMLRDIDPSTFHLQQPPFSPAPPLLSHTLKYVTGEMDCLMCIEFIGNLSACGFGIKQSLSGQIEPPTKHAKRCGTTTVPSVPEPSLRPGFRDLFFPSSQEIKEFERLLKGDFYTMLMEAAGIKGDRNELKPKFFHFLYRPPLHEYDTTVRWLEGGVKETTRTEEPIRKAFGKLLPAILLFLDICKSPPGELSKKGGDYVYISRAMLAVESQIILETCSNLWKKYPKMFLTTLHDCIKCLPEDADKVQEELKRTFEKYLISPGFTRKEHGKQSGDPKERKSFRIDSIATRSEEISKDIETIPLEPKTKTTVDSVSAVKRSGRRKKSFPTPLDTEGEWVSFKEIVRRFGKSDRTVRRFLEDHSKALRGYSQRILQNGKWITIYSWTKVMECRNTPNASSQKRRIRKSKAKKRP